MIKRFAIIAVMGLFIISCGQVKEQQTESSADLKSISELVAEPMTFEGQEVSFEGVITHICQHSGDKMRVNQVDDGDYSILVMLEDLQPQFSAEYEGRQVKLTGILKTQVRNMEELETEQHDHDGEEGHECASTEEAVEKLQEKGITPDIIAFIELKSFEVIEMETEQEDVVEEEAEAEEVVEVAEAPKTGEGC